jgi:subtilisin family serine protease
MLCRLEVFAVRIPEIRKRRTFVALTIPIALALAAVSAPASAAPQETPLSGKTIEFTVLGDTATVTDAVSAAHGKIERRNDKVGLYTVSAPANGFAERMRSRGFDAAPAVPIGVAPTRAPQSQAPKTPTAKAKKAPNANERVEKATRYETTRSAAKPQTRSAPGMDPLDDKAWGLKSIRADLARHKQAGDKRVKVGIIDTGVDSTHPDIAPNFDRADSRNFTHDIPYDQNGNVVDGPCEYRGCVDPADVDNGGHGTHVAGTIAAAANGFGVSGVAPGVEIVNVRGGQDSGSFFLQPVVDALTYAGDAGLDVVNMSFYVDPWLYNCSSNAADTPQQQAQQRMIVKAMKKALNYAHDKNVTLVAALGNEHSDLGKPQDDTKSPNYPVETNHPRAIDNSSCLSMPVEGPHVIGVGAYGPSKAKADYSNYGLEQISVSAPGGYLRDYYGTPWYNTRENAILSTIPQNVLLADGEIDAKGDVTDKGKEFGDIKQCESNGKCAYYTYYQGTSMATPHTVGVAALIVSQYGKVSHGQKSMSPDAVQRVLEGTASQTPCPTPRTVSYTNEGRDDSYTATCQGDLSFNGFYGHGSIDAWSAVTRGAKYAG